MGPIDYKTDIIRLVSDVDQEGKHEMGDLETRVEGISTILEQSMEAGNDPEIMGQIWTFVEMHNEPAVQNLRKKLLFNSSCQIETITLSKGELEKLEDELWNTIVKHGTKNLVIEQEGESIEYSERTLKQFMKMEEKPTIKALTEKYTLNFEEGEELEETKANLLLCGDFIHPFLTGRWKEGQEHKIDLSKMTIPYSEDQEIVLSRDIFNDILQEVKTGDRDLGDDIYELVCDSLQYTKWTPIPKGAIGPVQWEELYGLKVEDVPDVPKNILARLEALEKEGNQDKEKLILIPAGVSLNKMEELAQNPKTENKAKYRYYLAEIKEKHGAVPQKNSEWVLMTTEVIPESRGKTREEQLHQAEAYQKDYKAPTLLEAVILNFVTFTATGKRLFNDDPWTYTVCQEEPIEGWKLVVGGFAPAGLHVNRNAAHDCVGVAPVLRGF